MSQTTDKRYEPEDLVALFAPTLGREKSTDVVTCAARALNASAGGWSLEQALAIVNEMARTPGLVGIVSRLARARLQAGMAYRSAGGSGGPLG